MNERARTSRDRPAGLAPRGSSAGFGVVMLYWITIPALTCMALLPLGRTVFDFLLPALACPVLGLAVMLPMSVGFRSRRHWGVVMFFWGTVAAIVLLALSLLTVAIVLLETFQGPPPLIGMTWAVGAILLLLLALTPFPIKVLHLKYGRPNAPPSQWESGDERIPTRVVRALGGQRP